MSEDFYEQFGRFESEPTDLPSRVELRDIGILRKTEVLTENGGFSFLILNWKNELTIPPKSDVLCRRLGSVGELGQRMDQDFFVMGGVESQDFEGATGVIERGQPLLYRPVRLRRFNKINELHPVSQEGEDYFNKVGLIKRMHSFEWYLDAQELWVTSPVREVSLYSSGSAAIEDQKITRII